MALAILLAISAALAHATWNLLLKGSGDKLAFLWWTFAAATLLFTPTLVFLPHPFPLAVLPIIFASGLAEAGYCILLSGAYERGPFSQVYPLARGSAPIFLTVWAGLFLAERPSAAGLLGILLILTAIALIAFLGQQRSLPPAATALETARWFSVGPVVFRRPSLALSLAIGTGLCISIYSTIDKVGIHVVPPPAYLTLIYLMTATILAPYVWGRRGQALVRKQLRIGWRSIVVVGFLSGLTYLIILVAMQFGPVSYVGTARESSIIFGAIFGRFLLGEPVRRLHFLAVACLFAGIALLALAG